MNEKVNYVQEKSSKDGILLLACNTTSKGQKNIWYLNTGASNNMRENKCMFVEINETMNGNVAFGDILKVPLKDRGIIFFV